MEQHVSTPATTANRTTLRVWIDFVCPFCLLGEQVVTKATEGMDVDIVWMPFELREDPTPTLRPEDEYLPRIWKQSVYPMAERMGVDIRLPTVSPQPYTRNAFLGLQHAVEHEKGNEYVDAVLRAFFQQDRNIGETDVLKAILHDIGVDPDGLDAVLVSPVHGDRHDAALQQARDARISAVPSIAVGDRLFPGMPSPDILRAEILKQQG
jgi:predicted DsbA family dithiol-disulfide isomerase